MMDLLKQALNALTVPVTRKCKGLLLIAWSNVLQLCNHLWALMFYTVG